MKSLTRYLRSLGDPEFVPTGLKVAAIVGTLLLVINHSGAMINRQMTRSRWLSAGLSYGVPYLVSVHGQHSSKKNDRR